MLLFMKIIYDVEIYSSLKIEKTFELNKYHKRIYIYLLSNTILELKSITFKSRSTFLPMKETLAIILSSKQIIT